MNAAQTRQRPELAGTGREVDTAKQTVLTGYHDASPASTEPALARRATVARELIITAAYLERVSTDLARGVIDTNESVLIAVDQVLVGVEVLIFELQQQQDATP